MIQLSIIRLSSPCVWEEMTNLGAYTTAAHGLGVHLRLWPLSLTVRGHYIGTLGECDDQVPSLYPSQASLGPILSTSRSAIGKEPAELGTGCQGFELGPADFSWCINRYSTEAQQGRGKSLILKRRKGWKHALIATHGKRGHVLNESEIRMLMWAFLCMGEELVSHVVIFRFMFFLFVFSSYFFFRFIGISFKPFPLFFSCSAFPLSIIFWSYFLLFY